MFPADRDPTPLVVEWTSTHGFRVQELFSNAYAARRFYKAKFKEGKKPKIVAAAKAPRCTGCAELTVSWMGERFCPFCTRYRPTDERKATEEGYDKLAGGWIGTDAEGQP